jgi:hypothetical protein
MPRVVAVAHPERAERAAAPRRWIGLDRTPLAGTQSLDAELRKLAILRWAAGLLCLARTLPIVYGSIDYLGAPSGGGLPDPTVGGIWTLGIIALATVGVAAPLVLPLLIYEYQAFDTAMNTETLGSDVLLLLLALFWLTGAGARLSFDAYWLRRRGWSGAPIRALYSLFRIPSVGQLRQLYFLFFAAFAFMNFGAVLHHLEDPIWRSGSVMRVLFTSSYLSRLWEPFRVLESHSGMLLQGISIVGTAGQVLFQLFMVPLIWSRWGGRFIVIWGAIFFAASVLILQLSYLPILETFLWTALFWHPRRRTEGADDRYRNWIRSDRAGRAIGLAGGAVLTVFVLTGLPYTDDLWEDTPAETLRPALRTFGLEVPEVLNRDDLRMGDAWPVIYRREPGQDVLLPYHGLDGERLAWVQWNDLFYFGNSLKWRREFRGPESMARSSGSFSRLVDVALFDHRRRGAAVSEYAILYFATDGSNAELNVAERFERRHLGTEWITCSGSANSARCE